MNNKLLFIIYFIILSSLFNSAYSDECDSCNDCDTKLEDNVYLELNRSINTDSSSCIYDNSAKENVTIDCKGYNITCTSEACASYGIGLGSYSKLTLKNCNINGFYYGLYIINTNTMGIIENITINNAKRKGIYLYSTNNITIKNTTITNCGSNYGATDGSISISSSDHTNITHNLMQANNYGIYIEYDSDHNTITENTIINNNKTGIYLAGSSGNYPDNNTITDNKIRNNSLTESAAQKHEIKIESNCTYNNISNNALKHPISNHEPTTIQKNNYYSDLLVGPAHLFITDYATISAAIAAAPSYSLIHVMPGLYPECITINKPLSLRGESKTNTNITCTTGTAVTIESGADNTQISNFTIGTSSGDWAVEVNSVSGITIEENILVGSKNGLKLYNVENSIIYNNRLQGTDISAKMKSTTDTNISYNSFFGEFLLYENFYPSTNNNLWRNNFTSEDDTYNEDDNNYCVMGLDNTYAKEENEKLICNCAFQNTFNDTVIYINDTILFTTDTTDGESNYTSINATIDGANHTLSLASGDNIHGTWSCEFNRTNATKTYNASMLYYTEADGDKGASEIRDTTFTTTTLNMTTALNATIINITDHITIQANITGNATPITNILVQVYWNNSQKHEENMTRQTTNLDTLPPESGEDTPYIYTLNYNNTDRSGNYTINITVFAGKTIKNPEQFFVNYGHAEITLWTEPWQITNSTTANQTYTIKACNGDLINITSTLGINYTTVLDKTTEENYTKQIYYIFNEDTKSLNWQIEGKIPGTINLNVTTNTTTTPTQWTASKTITVTGVKDTVAPTVNNVWTQYDTTESSIFNLKDAIQVYANATDASGIKSIQANITMPDNTTAQITMESTIQEHIYTTTFTNTTLLTQYNITILASDGTNINNTESTLPNITGQYRLVAINTETNYNRGENATITIHVLGINNNTVTGFNTTLNITCENISATLIENNNTDTTKYYLNESAYGAHILKANISKHGNTGSSNATFFANNTYYLVFIAPDQDNLNPYSRNIAINPMLIEVRNIRNEYIQKEVNLTVTCHNGTSMSNITMSREYYYSSTEKCYSPSGYSQGFDITANSEDNTNNTGTKIIHLTTEAQQQQSSSPTGSSPTGGGIALSYTPYPNTTTPQRPYNNETRLIRDFRFSIKDAKQVSQGEDTTPIGTIENTGDFELNITITIEKECCIVTTQKQFTIKPKNKQDFRIIIHVPLTTPQNTHIMTFTATSGNLKKTDILNIEVTKNENIIYIEELKTIIPEFKSKTWQLKASGMNVKHIEDKISSLEQNILLAEEYIQNDNLAGLRQATSEAKQEQAYIENELQNLTLKKWLYENKYNITTAIIAIIILSYLAIYFIIPYYYLTKELKDLKSKELKFKDEERTVQKQYFMRQLDEVTFNKLMQEKHSALLDTRSQIKQIEEKISLLTRGKLNLKKEEHSKYFILNKITKNKQVSTEKKIDIKEKIKLLKEQEYNLVQSTKEAEKNYYSRIITQDELEQITNNNRAKTKTIKTQLHTLEKLREAAPQKQSTPKESIITKIKQKYTQYKLKEQRARIENKIHTLQKHENEIEEKDRELKTKEEQIKKEIEILKKQENQPTDSE